MRVEDPDIRHPNRPGVHDRGHAGQDTHLVWFAAIEPDPPRCRTVGDVGVHVDQARQDAAAGAAHLDRASRPVR